MLNKQGERDIVGDDNVQDDDMDRQPQQVERGEKRSAKRKQINTDYNKKKAKKSTHAVIGYQEALITGNPLSALARVKGGVRGGNGGIGLRKRS